MVFPDHTLLLFFSFLMKALWSALFKFSHLIDSNLNSSVSIYCFLCFFSMTMPFQVDYDQETFGQCILAAFSE